ncbi:uncharacterized protein LOC124060169 [Scomber scombrus]|uniref:Uncharacterized protein LOC124060169 n=1 Tax=Scomber scombrus TaxID=13677 RepID=A0AAV1PXE0_SCOSC
MEARKLTLRHNKVTPMTVKERGDHVDHKQASTNMEEPQTTSIKMEVKPVAGKAVASGHVVPPVNEKGDYVDQKDFLETERSVTPVTDLESTDESASGESEARAENRDLLHNYVTVLMVRVLTKCHTLKGRHQKEWIKHTKRLVQQTLEGLAESEGFCPNIKTTKRLSKAIIEELTGKFGGRRTLEMLILAEDSVVDAAIVKSVQDGMKDLHNGPSKKTQPLWREVLLVVGVIVGCLASIVLMLLVP